MDRQISEADWKRFRRLHPVALDRYCRAVLAEVARLTSDAAAGGHARYLEVVRLLQERDEELGAAFDDLKRSTALVQLAHLRRLGLVTDDEFAGFGAETQAAVSVFLSM